MRHVYSAICYLLLPFVLLKLKWRSRKTPEYLERWKERFGFYENVSLKPNGIWVHSVSLGETIAATPLIHQLKKQYPHLPITVTAMTLTGSARIRSSFANDPQIQHVYIPYDYPDAIARFLTAIKPKVAIIMETELWPNLFHACFKRNIPIFIANGRMSEKSARGYGRFKWLFAPMLKEITLIASQTRYDAKRFECIGTPRNHIAVLGNLKFDIKIPDEIFEKAKKFRQDLNTDNRPIFIAASTHAPEEEKILNAFALMRKKIPNLLLLLVPRHPERFNEVANLCEQAGWKIQRRSQSISNTQMDIFLGDTVGELLMFYCASDIAFVGGSFLDKGGHNPLEPAAIGVPILSGPSIYNFKDVYSQLKQHDACLLVNDEKELAEKVELLLSNENLSKKMCQRATEVVQKNQGSLERHLKAISELLKV